MSKMNLRLKRLYAFITAVFIGIFFMMYLMPNVTVEAKNTEETDWNGTSTGNLLPVTTSLDGWSFSGTGNVELNSGGIRPSGSSHDMGGQDYTGGMGHTIQLSTTDKARARAGQLTIEVSAEYYHQQLAGCKHYISARIYFKNEAGTEVGNKIATNIIKTDSSLSTGLVAVPAQTASIECWFSNYGTAAARPWIRNCVAKLHDEVAPQPISGALTIDKKNIANLNDNIALANDEVSYMIELDEPIDSLTAKFSSTSGDSTISRNYKASVTSKGTSSVYIYFKFPEHWTREGDVSLEFIQVWDKAKNMSIIKKFTGNVPIQFRNYSRTQNVTVGLNNMTYEGAATAYYNKDYSITLSPNEGYELPLKSELEVKIGNSLVDFTYSNGIITIAGNKITGPITIKGNGSPIKSTINFNQQGGIDGTASIVASYGLDMPTIMLPNKLGYTFMGYYTEANGKGTQYYDKDGKGTKKVDFVTDINLFAYFVPNSYTITFDMQGGAGGTEGITGIYDSALDKITIPIKKGYKFKGYYTKPNGLGTCYYIASGEATRNVDFTDNITLYAHWEAIGYSIKFDGNKPALASGVIEGVMINQNRSYDDGLIALTENSYSLKGYSFKGWALASDGEVAYSDKAEIGNMTSEENKVITLYAIWEANQYTITFDKATGVGGTDSITLTYDDALGKIEAPTRSGYTFAGYFTLKNGNGTEYYNKDLEGIRKVDFAENITLYANWEANTYTITFSNEGGSNTGAKDVEFDSALSTVGIPSRLGYNFLGYFTEPNGKGARYFTNTGEAYNDIVYTETSDITLYANWEAITYTIHYYSLGKFVYEMADVVYGELYLHHPSDFNVSRPNYDFVGWNIYGDQNWSMYKAHQKYEVGLAQKEGDIVVLNASWEEKPLHELIYDANGGVGSPSKILVHEEETIDLTNDIPTRQNYTFKGWSLTPDSSEVSYMPGAKLTMGNKLITLYAIWELNPKLSYDANGGSFGTKPMDLYPFVSESVIIADLKAKLKGHVFLGYSTDKNAVEAEYIVGSELVMPSTSLTLYAIYKKAEYTVTSSVAEGYSIVGLMESYLYQDRVSFTIEGEKPKVFLDGVRIEASSAGSYSFIVEGNHSIVIIDDSKKSLLYDANGGINAPIDNNVYENGGTAIVSTSIPTREGYTFKGWNIAKSLDGTIYNGLDEIVFANKDITLYAMWEANTYTVKFYSSKEASDFIEQALAYDTKDNLLENSFTKEGYTFKGWALDGNLDRVIYLNNEEVINLASENGAIVSLYAVWEKTKTIIQFDTSDGSSANDSIAVEYGSKLEAGNAIAPRRAGYRFRGYYTAPNAQGDLIFQDDMSISNKYVDGSWDINTTSLTLYPSWEAISYTITYMDKGKEVKSFVVSFDDSVIIKSASEFGLVAPKYMKFVGWSTISGAINPVYLENQTLNEALSKEDGDVVYLYSVYAELEKYNVIYNANGGYNAPIDNNKYVTKDEFTIINKIPSRDGYIFKGWTIDPMSDTIEFSYEKNKFDKLTGIIEDGDVILYAVWKAGENGNIEEQINNINSNSKNLEDAITALNTSTELTDKNVTDLTNAIADANKAIEELDNTYTSDEELLASVTELKSLISTAEAGLAQKVDELDTSLKSLIEEVNGIKNDGTNMGTSITDLQESLNATNSIIDALDNTYTTDAALEETVADLKTLIEAGNKAIDDKITAINDRIEEITTNLNKASEDITGLSDTDATLSTKIDDLSTLLDEANKVIDALDDTYTTDTDLEATVTELKASIKDTGDKISQKVNSLDESLQNALTEITSLQSKDTKLDENITGIRTDIKAISSSLSALKGIVDSLDTDYINEEELSAKITEITTNLTSTSQKLEDKMLEIKAELDKEINDLNDKLNESNDKIDSVQSISTALGAVSISLALISMLLVIIRRRH